MPQKFYIDQRFNYVSPNREGQYQKNQGSVIPNQILIEAAQDYPTQGVILQKHPAVKSRVP